MTYAPTTNAPARNANVEAYINPDPNPNPNPNPNPYPALNQKPNHTHESNSVFGEVSMPEQLSPEQLSPEHMSCHRHVYIRLSNVKCVNSNRYVCYIQMDLGYPATSYPDLSIIWLWSCSVYYVFFIHFHISTELAVFIKHISHIRRNLFSG